MVLSPLHVDTIIRRALKEDIGGGDVTTSLFVGPRDKARAELIVKEAGVVCGLLFFCRVFRLLDPRVRTVLCVRDGMYVKAGTVAAVVTGSAGAILRGERTALNIVQRLSGIASMTRRYVEESGGRIKILDTRKTTPGLR